jgi:hypothetical protein
MYDACKKPMATAPQHQNDRSQIAALENCRLQSRRLDDAAAGN